MDAKITKQRLGRLLSYDWIKIIALAVAAIVVWSLIFTMTATRLTATQQFSVFNYYCNGSLSTSFFNHYNQAFEKNVFSYEVIETNSTDFTTLSGDLGTMSQLLQAKMQTDEGDVMFIPNIVDESTVVKDENGEIVSSMTYMKSFFGGYFYYLFDIETYLADMATYLNGYYGGDYQKGTLDEEKVKTDFVSRIQRTQDKRFKTAEEIETGKQNEVARIQKYAAALTTFNGYLQEELISLTTLELKDKNGEVIRSGKYAINLCPDEDKMGKLKNIAYYNIPTEDENVQKPTALDMHVMLFDLANTEDSFEYEALLYLNAVIAEAKTA